MDKKTSLFLFITFLFLAVPASNSIASTDEPEPAATVIVEPTSAPTQTTVSVPTQPQANLPQTDAEVPRVSVDQAKAAFDRGEAVILDVRGADSYARSHIVGALDISLSEIQTNPTDLNLDKNKWIITYCT